MASAIIIPIVIVAILGLGAYLLYRYALFDMTCKKTVNDTLKKYKIQKTPSQIIKEFYEKKGETLSQKEIKDLEKKFRQTEPDQFLAMYDAIRDNRSD